MVDIKLSLLKRLDLLQQVTEDEAILGRIVQAGRLLKSTLRKGSLVLVCGNGGSAAEAQHLAGEMVGRYLAERAGLPVVALPADPAVLTAVGNDYGYEEVFARQVAAFKDLAKILVLISTTGYSKNLLKAASLAKTHGITTIGLLGRDRDARRVVRFADHRSVPVDAGDPGGAFDDYSSLVRVGGRRVAA